MIKPTQDRYYYVETFKGAGKQPWRWRIRAGNQRTVAVSGEGFVSEFVARRAMNNFLRLVRFGRRDVLR